MCWGLQISSQVTELGPANNLNRDQMLIYCPDWNGYEKRKKHRFYKVQNSDIKVSSYEDPNIPGQLNLVVWHGRAEEDAYYSKGDAKEDAKQPEWWEGYIWWERCGLYYWRIGNKGDVQRLRRD